MMRRTRKRTRTNNKGFSLIELLVAIAILMVAVIPLLHGFITAAYTNTKAKRVMEATSTAQNLIEEIKNEAQTPEDLGFQAYDKDGNPCGAEDPDLAKWVKEGIAVTDGGRMQIEDAATLDASKKDTGINGKNFYAKMTLTPGMTTEIAQISAMDSATAAIFNVTSDVDERAAYSLDPTAGTDVNRKNLKRVITVTIEKDGDAVLVKPQVSYNSETYKAYPDNYTLYKGKTDELKNIYIFYNALYEDPTYTTSEEVIIDNKDDFPVNVYVIRLNTPAVGYKIGLTVKEDSPLAGTTITHVVTNLDTTASTGDFSKLELRNHYNGIQANEDGMLTAVGLERKDYADEWLLTQNGMMMYDIGVEVYEKNPSEGGKLLASLSGTKTQ